tara:strand:+ start:358 stop:1095 length:738 start_codon:yes stop_codon:yes gene_type:complete
MKFLILAAGSGTRLGKQTETIPKALVKIKEKTILERQLDIIKNQNGNEVIVIAGPNKEKFFEFQVNVFYDNEFSKHEQLGSLISINEIFDEDVIVIFSDIIFDESVLDRIIKTNCDFGIAIDKNWEEKYIGRTQHPRSQADLVVLEENKIKKIKKNLKEKNTLEFIGITKFSSHGWKIFIELCKRLKKEHKGNFHDAEVFNQAYITDIFQELLDLNYDITPILIDGNWIEIDTPQDIEIANQRLN